MSSTVSIPKRLLVGRPLSSERMGETLLPRWLALPVFCSDPLSSNAYATEEILLVLSVGGLALLHLTPWVAAAVIVLLVTVVISYRQTCHAYPNGGGAYAVSRANLGQNAALVAAAALLIDYVLTVAVSVAAGVFAAAGPGVGPAGLAGPGRAPVDGRAAGALAAGASAGFAAPSASRAARSLRATGGAMVDEGLLTYSPSSFSFARATLLSTPISEAISCTRGFATILLSGVYPGQGRPLRADGSHFEPFTSCP